MIDFSGMSEKVKQHEVPHMRHLIGCTDLYGNISDPYAFAHKRQPDHDLD